MRTIRIRDYIIKILKDRDLSSEEILLSCNQRFKHGTSPNQLGNVLSKDIRIMKTGISWKASMTGHGGYKMAVWGLKPEGYDGKEQTSIKDKLP